MPIRFINTSAYTPKPVAMNDVPEPIKPDTGTTETEMGKPEEPIKPDPSLVVEPSDDSLVMPEEPGDDRIKHEGEESQSSLLASFLHRIESTK